MSKRGVRRFTVVIALILTFTIPSLHANQAPLRGEVQLMDASDKGVMVLLSLTNTTHEDIFVISYETALSGLEGDLFRIERYGEVIPYMGPMIMRIGPAPESWIRIPAGETVSAKLDLSSTYDLSRAGPYLIEYQASAHVLVGADESRLPIMDPVMGKSALLDMPRTTIRSAPVSVELDGIPSLFAEETLSRERAESGKIDYVSCTVSEATWLKLAKNGARTNACRACEYCDDHGCTSSWYDTWFGGCTHESLVCQNHCDACNVLWSAGFTFYCGGDYCAPNVIAYVYKDLPYEIWICPDFFTHQNLQIHAVTHEVFHWNIVAGAEDWTYGEANCMTLAAYYDPIYAATNADSYAYAADNSP